MISFEEAYASVRGFTLISPDRLTVIYRRILDTDHLDGDAAELGVFRGGSAKLIALASGDRRVHLFDTFEGLPEPSEYDGLPSGKFADTSFDEVRAYIGDAENIRYYRGRFPETLTPDVASRRFRLVHCDADLYRSARDFLDFFYPRMLPGGVMIFDDWGKAECAGVKRAIEEFLADKPERLQFEAQEQCFFFKLPDNPMTD